MYRTDLCSLLYYTIIIRVFCPRTGRSHCKLRNEDCSSTKGRSSIANSGTKAVVLPGMIGAVASHCFPHPTLFSIWTDLKRSEKIPKGTNVEVRRVNLANWAFRTSPKFTTGVKYQLHQGFWPDPRSGNPNHPSPTLHYNNILQTTRTRTYTHTSVYSFQLTFLFVTSSRKNGWMNFNYILVTHRLYFFRKKTTSVVWGYRCCLSTSGPGFVPRLRFFPGFFLNCHIRPWVSFGHHNYLKPYSSVYGRRRSLTLFIVHARC